jgi:hypothetical protein
MQNQELLILYGLLIAIFAGAKLFQRWVYAEPDTEKDTDETSDDDDQEEEEEWEIDKINLLTPDGRRINVDTESWSFVVKPRTMIQFQNYLLLVLSFILFWIVLYFTDDAPSIPFVQSITWIGASGIIVLLLPFLLNSRSIEISEKGIRIDRYFFGRIFVPWDQIYKVRYYGTLFSESITLYTYHLQLNVRMQMSALPFFEVWSLSQFIRNKVERDQMRSE